LVEVLLDAPALPDLLEKDKEFVGGFLLVRLVSVDDKVGAVHAHGAVCFGQLDFVEQVE
jgi:hypothetical protein